MSTFPSRITAQAKRVAIFSAHAHGPLLRKHALKPTMSKSATASFRQRFILPTPSTVSIRERVLTGPA